MDGETLLHEGAALKSLPHNHLIEEPKEAMAYSL
jgi:hypothetical protein